jgi:hypothetical protein
MRALLGLMGFGFGTRLLGLSFFRGNVALGFRFVLLRSTFATEFLLARHSACGFLYLAFDAFDGATHASFRPGLFVLAHCDLLCSLRYFGITRAANRETRCTS